MLQRIKANREVRIALAVCCGLLGYKFIVTLAWASWYYSWFGNWSPSEMLSSSFVAVLVLLASVWLWRRSKGRFMRALTWVRDRKRSIVTAGAILLVGVIFAANRGGREYTDVFAATHSEYDARLGANQLAAKYLAAYLITVLLLTGVSWLWRSRRRKSAGPE